MIDLNLLVMILLKINYNTIIINIGDINMERNREKINENGKINDYITVLNAYLNGNEIEYRQKESNEAWRLSVKPVFDFYHIEYRIKPKQIYRPYTSGEEAFTEIQEHSSSGWLYNTITMCYEHVICIASNGISTCKENYSYEQAFDTFIYPNDEKFGVKLNNNNNEEV